MFKLGYKTSMSAICRICFDGKGRGPLYSPCACTGSVKYIHSYCLLRWVDTMPETDAHPTCELCMSVYNIGYNRPREKDIDERIIRGNIIINPAIHVLFCCLFFTNMNYFLYNLMMYQILYASCCVLYVHNTVYNKQLYYRTLIEGRGCYVIGVHMMLWVYIIACVPINIHYMAMMFIAIQCYLSIYPILHFETIKQMNAQLKRVVRNV
jgi:hypothetical protein